MPRTLRVTCYPRFVHLDSTLWNRNAFPMKTSQSVLWSKLPCNSHGIASEEGSPPQEGHCKSHSHHNARNNPSQSILRARCEELTHVTAITLIPQECFDFQTKNTTEWHHAQEAALYQASRAQVLRKLSYVFNNAFRSKIIALGKALFPLCLRENKYNFQLELSWAKEYSRHTDACAGASIDFEGAKTSTFFLLNLSGQDSMHFWH